MSITKSFWLTAFILLVSFDAHAQANLSTFTRAPSRDTTGAAVGIDALAAQAATTSYNAAFGYQALTSTTTGLNNVGIGAQSLYTNTTGIQGTCVGVGACYSGSAVNSRTGVGYNALYASTGANSIGLGVNAGKKITSGQNNVVLGPNVATTTLTTGSYNLLIGTSSLIDTTASGDSYKINIGNTLFATSTGGGNFETKGTAPTVASGTADCGTSPTIAGNNTNMFLVVGTATNGSKCTVTFNASGSAWTNAPGCICVNQTSAARPVYALGSSTATFAVTAGSTISASDKLYCHCEGYR